MVLKPNFVRDFRESSPDHGDCLITHGSVIRAVLDYVYVKQPPGQRPLREFFQKQDGGHWQLRPNVPLLVVVRRDLLEAYRDTQARSHKAATGGRAEAP